MSKFKTPKNEKKSLNVHKIGGAHLQCVNNHYAKFEYIKGMNTVGVSARQPLRISDGRSF